MAVLGQIVHRCVHPELDTPYRVGLGADQLLLASTKGVLRIAQDLVEQLFLGREVPVEDPFAHFELVDDLGDRGGVVPVLGETAGCEFHQLEPAFASALGETASHGRKGTGA